MGFEVESYSLNELHRIAVPGTVAPSLFWALPVGPWNRNEIQDVWRWFTENPSGCHDYGLLLKKGDGRREREAVNVNLASLGARLSDLMPVGAERYFRAREMEPNESVKLLVLAGGFPQPGWGVLVEWQRGGIHGFEDLIQRTINRLREQHGNSDLDVFTEAAEAFHRLQNLRKPGTPDISTMEKEIQAGEKIDQFLREAHAALQAGDYKLVGERLIAAMQGDGQAAWLSLPEGALQSLLDTQRKLLTAASVVAVSGEIHAAEIAPQLSPLLADPSKREAVFRNLSSDAVKHALKACLHLRSKGIVDESGDARAWANQTFTEVPAPLEADMEKLRKYIESKLVNHRGSKSQIEHEHQNMMAEWRKESKKARESYHVAVGKAVEIQWKLSPDFLVAFEQICRQEGLWVRSVPWDPARMVGWKLMASQVRLHSSDLQTVAKEFTPDAAEPNLPNGAPSGVADGSYFTDYVHYIAISKPGFSPWVVTRDLLARLVRPAEMMSLVKAHTGSETAAQEASLLAEEVLDAFGWERTDDVREKPLASCISIGDEGAPMLEENLSGNDLRIVLESFCKDVIDVVVAQLGYDNDGIWGVISERLPSYDPRSRDGDWSEEVGGMTSGASAMILKELTPLAFSSQPSDVQAFTSALSQLTGLLNPPSHHREGKAPLLENRGEAAALVQRILYNAQTFMGDLPWHMEANFVYGQQPKVLSGEAWSHGSSTPRLLRVIVWTGASPGTHVKFWNKERRNPVVPDPFFITRPRKRP